MDRSRSRAYPNTISNWLCLQPLTSFSHWHLHKEIRFDNCTLTHLHKDSKFDNSISTFLHNDNCTTTSFQEFIPLMFFQLDQMSHHKVGEIMNGSTKHAAPPSVGQIVRTLKTLEKLFKKSDTSSKVRKCRPRAGSYFSSGFKAPLLKPHFLDRISSPRDPQLLRLSTYETRPLTL